MTAVCVCVRECVRVTERTTHHRHLTIFMYLSLTVAIDNINFFNFSGIMRSFNLLKFLLKDVCNISDNKLHYKFVKKIYIFFLFYFRAFIF